MLQCLSNASKSVVSTCCKAPNRAG